MLTNQMMSGSKRLFFEIDVPTRTNNNEIPVNSIVIQTWGFYLDQLCPDVKEHILSFLWTCPECKRGGIMQRITIPNYDRHRGVYLYPDKHICLKCIPRFSDQIFISKWNARFYSDAVGLTYGFDALWPAINRNHATFKKIMQGRRDYPILELPTKQTNQ